MYWMTSSLFTDFLTSLDEDTKIQDTKMKIQKSFQWSKIHFNEDTKKKNSFVYWSLSYTFSNCNLKNICRKNKSCFLCKLYKCTFATRSWYHSFGKS